MAKEFREKETFFESHDEAEEWIKQNVVKPGGRVSIRNLDLTLVSGYCRVFAELSEVYPELKNSYGFFESRPANLSDGLMEASGGITFQELSVEDYVKSVGEGIADGFFTGKDIYSAFVHEIGHVLDTVILSRIHETTEQVEYTFWRNKFMFASGVSAEIARYRKEDREGVLSNKSYREAGEKLSVYGLSLNDKEFFAEAFSEIWSNPDTKKEYALKFKEWLERVMELHRSGKNKDIPPAELIRRRDAGEFDYRKGDYLP